MTYRELVYLILDELKLSSDDAYYNEDHVIFLANKYRAMILKREYYSNQKKYVSEGNYQTLCLDLIEVPAIAGEPCEGGSYLRSKEKIPVFMSIGAPRVYPIDFYQGDIALVTRDRMRYVGYNKWMSNIIYCSLGPDNYLYFKSSNPQFLYLEKVKFSAVFEDPKEAIKLACEGDAACDILDAEFPIEDSFVNQLIQLVVQELRGPEYAPEENENNATDDLSSMQAWIRRNMKSNIQKQIEGDNG